MPGRKTFEDGHVPGTDFLDLQGEFSDNTTWLRFHGEWAKDHSLPIESDRAGRDARIRGTICAS